MQPLPNLHVQSKSQSYQIHVLNHLVPTQRQCVPNWAHFTAPKLVCSLDIPCQFTTTRLASKPKKLDTHLWFLSSIPFNQANTKFYYPIILMSPKFVYFSPFVLLTPCPPVLMIIISSSGAMLITSHWTPCIHSCILPGNIFYANLTMSLPSYNLSMISKRPENRVRMP